MQLAMYTDIWLFLWQNKYKPLQFIDTSLAISDPFIHQSKRKRSSENKDVRIYFDEMD